MTEHGPHDLARARGGASDEELVRDVRAGASAAYAQLYLRHRDEAQAVAQRWGAAQDAPDVVHEAFLRILDSLQTGQGPTGRFLPYLLRTVRNESIDRSRRSQRVEPLEDAGSALVDEASAPVEDHVEALVDHDLLASAFASLPDRWREILWMTEVEGVPPRALTAHFQLGANSVAQLARRAREGLRAAWIRVNSEPTAAASCRDARGALLEPDGARIHDAAFEHASGCEQCRPVLVALERLSDRPRAVLLPALLGSAPLLEGLREIIRVGAAHTAVAAEAGSAVPVDPSETTAGYAGQSSSTGPASSSGTTLAGAGASGGWVAAAAISALVLGGIVLAVHMVGSTRTGPPAAEAATTSMSPGSERTSVDSSDMSPTSPAAPEPSGSSETTRSQPHDGVGSHPDVSTAASSPPSASPAEQQDPARRAASSGPSLAEGDPLRPDTETPQPVEPSTQTPSAQSSSPSGSLRASARASAPSTDVPPESSSAEAEPRADGGTEDSGTSSVTPSVAPTTTTPVAPTTTTPVAPTTNVAERPGAPSIDPWNSDDTVLVRAHITGTGQPGASVRLQDQSGKDVAYGTVDDDGTWALTPEPPEAGSSTWYTAVQEVDGVASEASARSELLTYDAPRISSPRDGSRVAGQGSCSTASRVGTSVHVAVSKQRGEQFRFIVDGSEEITDSPGREHHHAWLCLDHGEHTIGIAYWDPSTGELGAIRSSNFRVD
ncbi:sigma-70 family RNA polymerase sigma factor [Brachybacterium sp. MASK1Z-5]|uniref:Sigma-70 family RNA polymerase sigma factor n=1 Tax=Brachybacterium halotolerans TaxID=2795215 RepID=A0ABS1B7D7_9MICO|nr:sigma-70 family RNA polymerase sigma factor [Brachybacterium halotolerans]MBK0330397.1 sigma-70 family RNA polymerase sigma factor [Brachybacterium halotolerans]